MDFRETAVGFFFWGGVANFCVYFQKPVPTWKIKIKEMKELTAFAVHLFWCLTKVFSMNVAEAAI